MEEVIETEENIVVDIPTNCRIVDPLEILSSSVSSSHTCLLVLNQQIGVDFLELWRKTELHICADGGANRLYEYFGDEATRSGYIPQFITGDLDSLRDEIKHYYQARGTVIIPQYTQYATDFNKAISLTQIHFDLPQTDYSTVNEEDGLIDLESKISSHSNITIYILNGVGGRFDQTIHSIHQLYQLQLSSPQLMLSFITNDDVVFLVPKGTNYVKYDTSRLGPICGLLPLGRRAVLNTWGLKWDVRNWESDMISKVSSSNSLHGKYGCVIQTDEDIVMNIEFNGSL